MPTSQKFSVNKKSGFTTFMKTERGFTLIELLVVVAIIAILSLIGLAIFADAQKNARDAKRRVDIDSISKAYEANYKPQTGYRALLPSDFTGGQCPIPPEGGEYVWVKAPASSGTARGFQVCAKLEGYSGNCPATGADADRCYCKASSLEQTTDTITSPATGCSTSTAVVPPPPPPPPPPAPPPPASTSFKRVFVTSSVTNPSSTGNLAGLNGADIRCNNRANAASLGGTWRAWVSTSTVHAKDRIPDTEYRRLDGVVVANNKADLTDGDLDNPINVSEAPMIDPSVIAVWTGTAVDGTNSSPAVTIRNCNDWESEDTSVKGTSGFLNRWSDASWTAETLNPCHPSLRLYCFEL